ncbi:triacylglycerol lipase [Dyadobacter sp. CY347]|uniref:esterase/lipase family protein n=1 Tax=Dyadobacter sp. CY347 TaxID=2909336 RepID=UPI001F237103|nr:hypothetical protein [Dyadobacter sp. CY347]MCF2489929.1 hypothetical protein [Dyadobacter sp. CY347]
MNSNHTTSCAIAHGLNTQGFFSYEVPSNIIIFVHGFGGSATGTWNNFLSMILFDDHFKKTDVIFYGYDTLKGQASDHSAQLYNFLNLLESPGRNHILPPLQNLPERSYQSILLVAHSLGAVLVRQAQLLASIADKQWVDKSKLALFAPAHNGAQIVLLALESLPGLLTLLGVIAKFKYPILSDLTPGEGLLKNIKEHTKDLQNQGKGDFSKAQLVIHAKGDKVIRNHQYLLDSPARVIENSNHTKVCKPTQVYSEPLEYIKSIVKING